jgi:hypothetical protein
MRGTRPRQKTITLRRGDAGFFVSAMASLISVEREAAGDQILELEAALSRRGPPSSGYRGP